MVEIAPRGSKGAIRVVSREVMLYLVGNHIRVILP